MTREEKIEKIRSQYMLTEVEEEATCRSDIVQYLESEVENIGDIYKDVTRAIWQDTIELGIVRCVNWVCNLLGIEEQSTCFLEEDIATLIRFRDSIDVYIGLYQRLIDSVTDDNWSDIGVLAEFTGNKFLETDDYYDKAIGCIMTSAQGITCSVGGEDETAIVKGVFDEALGNILAKGKEKVRV